MSVPRPALVLAATTCAIALVSTPAAADSRHHPRPASAVTVVAEGLNGPRQLSEGHHQIYVAESDAGQITRVDPRTGRTRVVLSGLASPQGVVRIGDRFYVATGGAPDSGPGAQQPPAIMTARAGQTPTKFADPLAYELAANPDGQSQEDPAADALSNPYFLLRDRSPRGFLLLADAAGNAILRVDRRGRLSTLVVLPVQETGACAEVPNNSTSGTGCDPVPTGMAYGPDGLLYVSALTAELPGEGRVYLVDPRSGRIVRTLTGFTGPTGVEVDRRGTVYVSELFEGAPAGEPGPGFDPSTLGQITRVAGNGRRTHAQVTEPTGLLIRRGELYASAWSVAGFLPGIPDAGQVVAVGARAFVPAS